MAIKEGASIIGTIMATMVICGELLIHMSIEKEDIVDFLDDVLISRSDETEH